MRNSTLLLAPLALTLTSLPAAAQCVDQVLDAPGLTYGAGMGNVLATAGDFVFASAPYDSQVSQQSGRVEVFLKTSGGLVWSQSLTSPDASQFDYFGQALDAAGEWVVVGTRHEAGSGEGGADVFHLTPQGWVWHQNLESGDPDLYWNAGVAVAIDGTRIAMGAPDNSNEVGAVFVFELIGGVWTEITRVDPVTPQTVHGFGTAVDLSGDRLLVGATYLSAGGLAPGAGFVFDLEQGTWTQKGILVGDTSHWEDSYGRVVALDGDTAALSGRNHLVGTWERGAVWIFEFDGAAWHETQMVVSTPASESQFGSSIDLDGGRLAVGARSYTDLIPSAPFAETFVDGPTGFERERTLWGPSGWTGSGFGDGIALWGDAVIVGNSTGGPGSQLVGDLHLFDLPRIETAAYCQATANSTGSVALLEVPCPGIQDGELQLRATYLPEQVALFLAGTTTANLPVQDGFLCLGGSLVRLAPGFAAGGVLAGGLPLGDGSDGAPLPPGSTWYVQAWYRDPAAGKSGGNFSPGLAVTRTY